METRVLVAYATKYGATAGIAEKIGQVLREAGLAVDVKPAGQAGDPGGYQAVVLGSAVYIGRWRKEAAHYLKANEKALAQRPVWLFNSGCSTAAPWARAMRPSRRAIWASPRGCAPSRTASKCATSPSFSAPWTWRS